MELFSILPELAESRLSLSSEKEKLLKDGTKELLR